MDTARTLLGEPASVDPLAMTAEERAAMERHTLEMHAEARALLEGREPRFGIPRRRRAEEDGRSGDA